MLGEIRPIRAGALKLAKNCEEVRIVGSDLELRALLLAWPHQKEVGPGRARPVVREWSRRQDSNLQQAVYKTATLPLRHAGTRKAP